MLRSTPPPSAARSFPSANILRGKGECLHSPAGVQNPRFDTSLSPLCLVHLRLQRRIALGRGHGLIRLRLPSRLTTGLIVMAGRW